MANHWESENYVAAFRPIFRFGTGMPSLRNIVRSATYAPHKAWSQCV